MLIMLKVFFDDLNTNKTTTYDSKWSLINRLINLLIQALKKAKKKSPEHILFCTWCGLPPLIFKRHELLISTRNKQASLLFTDRFPTLKLSAQFLHHAGY